MSKKTDMTQEKAVELPRNVQQIGTSNHGIKVYLEDYSGTYIRRILSEETGNHGILLGKKRVEKNQTYIFVQAVIAVEKEPKDNYWKYNWNTIYDIMQKYFIEEGRENLEVLGWAAAGENCKKMDIQKLEEMHKSNFSGNMSLAFLLDKQDGGEQFYILENNKFHSLNGYYIYYEKNKAMQTYVEENQPRPCVETEMLLRGNSESYRTILQRRKEMIQRRHTVSVLYVASTFLVMIVVVLGITTMNNYEKMQNMQKVLNDLSKSFLNEEPQVKAATSQNIQLGDSQTVVSTQTQKGQGLPASAPAVLADDKRTGENNMGESAEAVQAMSGNVVVKDPQQNTDENNSATEKVSEQPSEKPSQKPSAKPEDGRKHYEIQPGDTLLSISLKEYGTVEKVDEICEYNGLEDGNQIVAGDVLILP